MSLPTQSYKGARDFYPADKFIQNYLFRVMREIVKQYGYEEYDAPILEPLELYKAKSGNEIAEQQTYSFTDKGGREVAIRPEMTPTVSRMVAARRQELPYPLRWFSIPNLWRYERPQKGRLREHWQLNVDIFGEDGTAADHEIILIADRLLKAYGAKSAMYRIEVNSRKLVDAAMQSYLQLDSFKSNEMRTLLDKADKLEPAELQKGIGEITDNKEDVNEKINSLLGVKTLNELPQELIGHDSVAALVKLLNLLNESGVMNVEFNFGLMRGFDYYTDIVFEVFDTDPDNNRSMFGGGRYDGLVGLFGVDPVATVGFGMGDVTLLNFLNAHNLLPKQTSEIDINMLVVGDVYVQAFKLADRLREMELNVSIDATSRKLDKKLKNADKLGVRYVMFVGEEELSTDQFPVKDLVTGKESKHSAERIASLIKDYRS